MALMHVCVWLCFSDIVGKSIKQAQGQGNCLKACLSVWQMPGLKLIYNYFVTFSFSETLITMFPFCCLSIFKFLCFRYKPIYRHKLKLYCKNWSPRLHKWFMLDNLLPPKIWKGNLSLCVGCINPATRRVEAGVCIATQPAMALGQM